ncbi:MAG: hypothetical protein IT422_25630 [Pirellulaceae bacterium]|nr:hypothetical protein [Pirellulaceae bacterium]
MLTSTNLLERSLGKLGWLEPHVIFEWNANAKDTSACWFRELLMQQDNGAMCLTPRGVDAVTRLLEAGWTLRSGWPRSWSTSVERWLGQRMIVAHGCQCADTVHFTSLISSQVGRYGSGHPEWPQWLDGALRHVRHHGHRLLIAPSTTLAESVEQFALTAGMELAKVDWTKHQQLDDWLQAIIALPELSREPTTGVCSTIFLSPTIEPAAAALEHFPLQDRLSIALADQVLALSVRDGGKLEELLKLRLQDSEFPTASVYVTLPMKGAMQSKSEQAWLDRGAVGWITTTPSTITHQTSGRRRLLGNCRLEGRDTTGSADSAEDRRATLQQLVSPLPSHWRQLSADDDSDYLVHCTRATIGPLPGESEHSFRMRVWSRQEAIAWQPLETLAHICREGRLRATSMITRTDVRCVSFSAVPLVPLLKRRTFRSHLGRWDWEPYGLLVRRDALQQIGARQVVYGDEADYEKLTESDKPFFQPLLRRTNKPTESWAKEREWRVAGDVHLRALPASSVVLFVCTQIEAQQFSRHVQWPVLWAE